MFLDEAVIKIKAGNGGRGCVSFLREKFVPEGGPDGGRGGKGGDVVFKADENLNTLYHLAHSPRFVAQDGEHGGSKNCSGKSGRDLTIPVPPGTLIYDNRTKILLKDLTAHTEGVILARGGKGGRGNSSFATSTLQSPRRAEPGEDGVERTVRLELKLIADGGLIGLPNAGKSTLLAAVTAARPKIAGYPFTTLHPYLGIVDGGRYRTCVLADLPGLIEGAHTGVGLGDRFLKHIERTRILIHLVDVSPSASQPPLDAYKTVRRELEQYGKALTEKPEIIVATKMDVPGSEKEYKRFVKKHKNTVSISAASHRGLKDLIRTIFSRLSEQAKNK